MIFEIDLPSNEPLDGYNNSIIEFRPTDEVKTIKNAVIISHYEGVPFSPKFNQYRYAVFMCKLKFKRNQVYYIYSSCYNNNIRVLIDEQQ